MLSFAQFEAWYEPCSAADVTDIVRQLGLGAWFGRGEFVRLWQYHSIDRSLPRWSRAVQARSVTLSKAMRR